MTLARLHRQPPRTPAPALDRRSPPRAGVRRVAPPHGRRRPVTATATLPVARRSAR
jgi:hypothetical protein